MYPFTVYGESSSGRASLSWQLTDPPAKCLTYRGCLITTCQMDEGMKGQMEWKLCALRPKIPEELPLLLLLLYCACYLYQNILG